VYREVNPKLGHRVSPELEHLLSVALSKNLSQRPYVNEMRYHCWVSEEPLAEYLGKGIVYQADRFVHPSLSLSPSPSLLIPVTCAQPRDPSPRNKRRRSPGICSEGLELR
jgi:hypothetical protein